MSPNIYNKLLPVARAPNMTLFFVETENKKKRIIKNALIKN